MSKKEIKVSVIICAYTMDRYNDVLEAVDSVLQQSLKPHEVVVAVDHNEVLLEKLASELSSPVKVISNTGKQGLSDNRNEGIKAAAGDIVAFIDDDAVADKDWLKKLTGHFERPDVAAVGGRAVPKWMDGDRPGWFPEELDWIIGCTYKGMPVTADKEIRNVIGCNMAFRKIVCEEVGYFKNEFGRIGKTQGVGEESELCIRIKRANPESTILYDDEAVIFHRVPSWRLSIKYLVQRSYNEGFYKNLVNKVFKRLYPDSLSTENSYLRYLVSTSILGRLAHFYRRNNLLQACSIVISIIATGTGYMTGRLKSTG